MKRHFDVIIVGAGMVGATLAVALSRHRDLRIALVEARLPPPLVMDDPADQRVSALTRGSERLLTHLGIWPQLMPSRLCAFTDMKVWETSDSELHFDSAELGEPWLGHLVENRHLQQACLRTCSDKANIELIAPAQPVSLQGARLHLDTGMSLSADLVVAADGAASPLREWTGIQLGGWRYDSKALVCTVNTALPHAHTAWQRFLPQGPLAFLPLPDPHQCSIVWSLDENEADRLLAAPKEIFLAELSGAFQSRLGELALCSERAAFPLQLKHASRYVETGFALVGDAAHTLHPLAGQGVNIGLLDAITLAEVVIDAATRGRQIGSLHTLRKYELRRRADNGLMQLSMDAFKRVFGSQLPMARWARQLGLRGVNRSRLLKQLFMQQAAVRSFARPTLLDQPDVCD